jgi:2-dehydro-3-deoxyphosphogluconate aldolase/(4S)-4-hydroxy-2-oxoglutarate aldolase
MLEQLKSCPLVPVFFHADADHARHVVTACYAAGLRCFEFTNRGPEAHAVFTALAEHVRADCPGLLLGIGTIYTAEDARRFLDAGADFVVQPVTTASVGAVCRERDKPWIPGALTPNEIWAAWQLGATAVKIFPGQLVGPDYLRALRGPMPEVPLMVTGGVEPEAEKIRPWLEAGAMAVGLGSHLFGGGDGAELVKRIAAVREALAGSLC